MATGLFDSPPRLPESVAQPTDEAVRYRALGGVAIAAAALAVCSPLAFLDWWLAVVPVLGLVLGLVALRDIAARPDVLTGRPLAIASIVVSAASLVGGLGYLAMVYAAELPEGFKRLNYAMLQPLDGDPPDAVPETARAMDGRNVLLKGYMYPGKQQQGITQFLLVRDQGDCCFGGNPKITDRVLVQLRDPSGIPFSPRLTKIAGRFAIRPAGTAALDGGVLYHLEGAVAR
jgi:hypothetical protein